MIADQHDTVPFGRAEKIGRWFENVLLVGLLSGMIGLAGWQVVMRVAAGTGVAWADESLRLMVLWAAMAGAIAASRDDAHLRIDLVSRYLPPRGRLVAASLVDLFAALVAGMLAWYSAAFVGESREYGDLLLGDLPAWPFQAVLPVAFALIGYRYLIWAGRRVLGLFSRPAGL